MQCPHFQKILVSVGKIGRTEEKKSEKNREYSEENSKCIFCFSTY